MSEQSQQPRMTIQQRINAVRERHPDLRIETDLASLDAELVVFKAHVAAGSASASAHVAVTIPRSDARQATIERAEAEAINRALDRLGFPLAASQPTRPAAVAPTQREATPPPVIANREPTPIPATPAAEPSQPEPRGPERSTATTTQEEEPDLADFSWTAFWVWAKAQNISTRGQVVEILGHPVDNMTPGAIRRELVDRGYRGEG